MSTIVSGVTATSYLYTAVTVAWNAVAGATSYLVQYKERGTVSWTNAPTVVVPNTHTTVTGLKVGITYDFRVYANGV